jgi:hypothetical protein
LDGVNTSTDGHIFFYFSTQKINRDCFSLRIRSSLSYCLYMLNSLFNFYLFVQLPSIFLKLIVLTTQPFHVIHQSYVKCTRTFLQPINTAQVKCFFDKLNFMLDIFSTFEEKRRIEYRANTFKNYS